MTRPARAGARASAPVPVSGPGKRRSGAGASCSALRLLDVPGRLTRRRGEPSQVNAGAVRLRSAPREPPIDIPALRRARKSLGNGPPPRKLGKLPEGRPVPRRERRESVAPAAEVHPPPVRWTSQSLNAAARRPRRAPLNHAPGDAPEGHDAGSLPGTPASGLPWRNADRTPSQGARSHSSRTPSPIHDIRHRRGRGFPDSSVGRAAKPPFGRPRGPGFAHPPS